MQEIAKREGCNFLCAGSMRTEEVPPLIPQFLKDHHFHQGQSQPLVYVEVKWSSFDEYLANFRSSYRRKILNDITLSEKNNVKWERHRLKDLDLKILFNLYKNVYERAEFKIEFYKEEYFRELAKHLNEKCHVITGTYNEKIIAFGLLVEDKKTIHLEIVGLDYAYVVSLGSYRNLSIEILRFAIESQFEWVELGANSYHLKQRLGGIIRPVGFFFRHLSPWKNFLIGKMIPVFFPRFNPRALYVFSKGRG